MPARLKKINGSSQFGEQWNSIVTSLARTRVGGGPLGGSEGSFESPNGAVRDIPRPSPAQTAMRLAVPLLFDAETDYSRGVVVVVPPNSPYVTDGVASADSAELKFAIAGMWVCLRSGTIIRNELDPDNLSLAVFNLPTWPLTTEDDPDAEDSFWWPISFYPSTRTDCREGEDVQVFENAQDKRDEET